MCSYYPLTIDLNENSNERYIIRHNSNLDYLTKNLIREFKEFKNIPNSLKELYSKKTVDLIYNNFLSIDEKKLIEKYTKNELKIMCKNNYVTTLGVNGLKYSYKWAQLYLESFKWSFNTFYIGVRKDKNHILNGQFDIIDMIHSYL